MMNDGFDAPGDGDTTKRVKRVIHSEMRTVKKIQFWATLGLTVAGLGFGAAMWMTRYAQVADVEVLSSKQDSVAEKLQEHIVNESEKLGAIQAQSRRLEEDYHFQREQMWRVADRVGAPRVRAPEHKEETP